MRPTTCSPHSATRQWGRRIAGRESSLRVLFTTLPGAGDFYPLIPLARALAAAGHAVAFAAAPRFCPEVAAADFHAIPGGLDWLLTDREEVYARARERAARGEPFSVVRDVFAGTSCRRWWRTC